MTRAQTPARGFWPLRDLPVVFWLAALGITTLIHTLVPAPRWLMIHLLLLGAVTHSILVWSKHFADALLHTAANQTERRTQSQRLLLLNGGVLFVVAGVLAGLWPLTVVGASAVASAVVWHGCALVLQMKRALPARFAATVHYYIAAACFLPVGAVFGTLLARGLSDPLHDQMVLAHAAINLLGWMGFTIVGTLVTLWPTMLRTRIAAGSERAAQRALPVLVVSVVVIAVAALSGLRVLTAIGLIGYLIGLGIVAGALYMAARGKPPSSFPALSVLCGLLWLAGCVAAAAVGVGTASSWAEVGNRFGWLTPFLAAGFGAQVLFGALSYLIPMSLGGGPGPVRAANTAMDKGGALRIVMVNAALLVCALPVPSVVRVACSALALVGLASFLPLLFLAIRASRTAKQLQPAAAPAPTRGGPRKPARPDGDRPRGQVTGLAATGFAAVVLAVAVGVAIDPTALAGAGATTSASAGVVATGKTTTVQVSARNMRFTPSTIKVPAGNRLVIELKNTDDEDVHDLVLDSGKDSGRLSPGESTRMDVGVVGRDIDGWCSVVGHRQMGMVLDIEVTGRIASPAGTSGRGDHAHGPGGASAEGQHDHGDTAGQSSDAAADLDFMADPGADFAAHNPVLPPLGPGRVHRRTFTVQEVERGVAPGVTQRLWTFNGNAPGPVLHGRVGDFFEITLVNDGTMGHSIDFHAGALAPDEPMRTIAPGESVIYRFRATRAGVWMYHCSTMPMSAHIANGLFGAVVIEPPDLPPVDRSYLLVQSEFYLGAQGGPVDMDKVQAERPDAVVFNGHANQYDHRPLRAQVGERVRIWVLDAGPNRSTSFHVVGGQFDTVYSEGGYLLRPGAGGSQSLALAPAQGGFVELTFPEAGHYPFVSHVMVDSERGAHGIFKVSR